ncbi:alpha/beta fold hydrolase [Massilia sp.]|uniref:alpha/beta fold hydrolase n=1 Tax=Massilia sp. TaxID=1882437 RepID=UPI0028B23A25|nr:alpha/beta fold hydrolase [Massilia sp.]
MYASNWNDLSTLGVAALKQMDRSRQARGQLLDRAGYGPRETPSTVLHAEPGLKLRRYGASLAGPAVLLVPAPIKRAYIWDLAPEISVVQRWLERGYRVYLAEWVPLDEADAASDDDFNLTGYADRLLTHCREHIRQDSGEDKVVIAGHSLGGILAAIHACLYPEAIAATVLLEAPLGFDPASDCFAPLVQATPDARRIADAFGQVPGSFLNMMSAAAEPHAFGWERLLDRTASMTSPQALSSYMQVERWTHDEFPLPGPLFVDLVESLYRNDAFTRGKLAIGRRTVGPHDMKAPLASVFDARSKVIPPQSVMPFHDAAASTRKLLLEYSGDIGVNLQHVGVLVGRNAHARIWPAIFSWLEALHEAAEAPASVDARDAAPGAITPTD